MVTGFVSVGYSIPAQAEVQGQPVVYAPVVLNIGTPGNIRPGAYVLNGKFFVSVIAAGTRQAKQEIREAISSVSTLFGEATKLE